MRATTSWFQQSKSMLARVRLQSSNKSKLCRLLTSSNCCNIKTLLLFGGYASVGEVNGNEGPVSTVVDWDE